ncbi:hypothetical protein RBB50_009804 [Rhinocladiella similis]
MLISGCSGSGKTHMIQQLAKPFFRSNKRQIIQVVSPTNAGTKDRTENMANVLTLYGNSKKFVIRVFGPNTEESIRNRVFVDNRRKSNDRPEIEDCDPAEMSRFDSGRAKRFKGVYDPRIEDIDHSLGQFFLWYIGMLHHPDYTHPAAEERFADIRQHSTIVVTVICPEV